MSEIPVLLNEHNSNPKLGTSCPDVSDALPTIPASESADTSIQSKMRIESGEMPAIDLTNPAQLGFVKRISDAYFEPKSFESTHLYERLGIRVFKKYLPTSGDLMMHRVFHSSIISTEGSRIERVGDYEKTTRSLEALHLGGFAVSATLFAEIGMYHTTGGIATASAFQAGVNIYPIMLQRYNRIRANRALKK